MPEKGTLLTRDVTPYEAVQRKKRVEQENAFRRSRKLGLSARGTNQQQKSSALKAASQGQEDAQYRLGLALLAEEGRWQQDSW